MFKKLIVAFLFVATLSPVSASATQTYNNETDNSTYWGDRCVRLPARSNTYTWDATREDTVKVVVNGGDKNKVYDQPPFSGLTAVEDLNAGGTHKIDFVIECYEEKENDCDCDEEEIPVCEHDQTLRADDEDCQPEVQCNSCGGQGGETPQKPTPEVLGEQTETPTAEPVATLAETGVSAILSVAVGACLVVVAAFLRHKISV